MRLQSYNVYLRNGSLEARFKFKSNSDQLVERRKQVPSTIAGAGADAVLLWAKAEADRLCTEIPDKSKAARSAKPLDLQVVSWSDFEQSLSDYLLTRVSDDTIVEYLSIYRREIVPGFGANTPLRLVSQPQINAFMARVIAGKNSNSKIKQIANVLRCSLRCARLCDIVKLQFEINCPKSQSPRVGVLTPEQYETSLQLASDIGGLVELAVWIAGETGMRAGEIGALTWSDIDFENRKISVSKQADRKHGNVIKQHTKSKKARTISYTKRLHNLLTQTPVQERRGRLFPGFSSSRMVELGARILLRLGRVYDLPAECRSGLHIYRHCLATRIVTAGLPLSHVQAQLGHSSIQTTEIYLHQNKSVEAAIAINALDALDQNNYSSNSGDNVIQLRRK